MDSNKYLIIGGSTKCGTTSVFKYFEFHPDVCPCIMKESRFFWNNDYFLEAASRDHTKYSAFSDLFQNCEHKKLRLEATPDYLYSAATAHKIKAELTNCKFVFILRDPIDRLISWFKFARLNGLIDKQLSFEEYIKQQKDDSSGKMPQHMRALSQGKYYEFLRSYIEIFGPENILVTFYEDLSKNPSAFCNQICEFGKIDTIYFKNYDFKIFNPSVATRSVGIHQLFRKFKRTIRPVTRKFNYSLRKKIKSAGYKFETAFMSANKDQSDEMDMKNSDSMLETLRKYYISDVEKIKSITGKTPPWRNFYNE
ncbi:MAG TPA: sulfotransferase domain-containing protein [Bacteroidia bacterium]|nr:sulfotransferase domain-containing protein [Bacteroidia bacterium]